jgi:prolyl 4-hydroxylase
MATGHIEGVSSPGVELTAGDCFELGRQSYVSGDYKKTVAWMNEAELRLALEADAPTAAEEDIVEYLAFSAYMMGK